MYWYFEKNRQQVGPFTDEQFQQAVRSGEVLPNTLVWNETLTGWIPYNKISRPEAPFTVPPVPISQTPEGSYSSAIQCSQCSRIFPHDEMIQYQNVWICATCKPLFFQRIKEGGRPGGAWSDGKFLVASKGAALPDRCVKCNSPANGVKITRKLYWHPPAYYALICGGVLLYAIVALIVRKSSVLDLGICQLHRNKRRRGFVIAWSLVGLALILFVAGVIADEGGIAGIGGFLLFTALIVGAIVAQFVQPRKIDADGLVWLKGVNPEYLQQLPLYPKF